MTLLLTFLTSLASGAGHQASSAIASKHCFSVKNKPTITFCSNATECVHFIKFWSDNHVPWTKHHPNCYSRWYCEVRWKFVATTKVGTHYKCIIYVKKSLWIVIVCKSHFEIALPRDFASTPCLELLSASLIFWKI